MHTGQDLVVTARSGSVPIMGTFAVNLQAVSANGITYSTAAIITGLTENHSISVTNMGLVSGATANATTSTGRILLSVQPQVGQATLTFMNTGVATNASDMVFSYIATLIKPLGTP